MKALKIPRILTKTQRKTLAVIGAGILLSITPSANANTWSPIVSVNRISAYPTSTNAYLVVDIPFDVTNENCTHTTQLAISVSSANFDVVMSILMSSKYAGKKFQVLYGDPVVSGSLCTFNGIVTYD